MVQALNDDVEASPPCHPRAVSADSPSLASLLAFGSSSFLSVQFRVGHCHKRNESVFLLNHYSLLNEEWVQGGEMSIGCQSPLSVL